MTIGAILLVASGGFFGAILRFFLSQKMNHSKGFPFGTLFVNLAGSLWIGIIFGMGLPKLWTLFLVSGFAGALTTFSTLQKEVIEQWRLNKKKEAVLYVLVTYIGGIALAFIGFIISR